MTRDPLLVGTIMTPKPRTVPGDTSLEQALELMGQGSFRHLPVVDDGRLSGVVSERDVLEALGRVPQRNMSSGPGADRPRLVRDVMTSGIRTVSPKEPIDVAAALFNQLGIGCLPVVDEGVLTGIVTEMDLAGVFDDLARGAGLDAAANPPVGAHMTTAITSVDPDMSVQDACSTCLSLGVRHLPVVEDGRLVGIVSDRDLRAAATHDGEQRLSLADIMSTLVQTVTSSDALSEAARRMLVHKITTLPVVDDGQLVGIISLSDVLGHCVRVLR